MELNSRLYNLIILDESGSMCSVARQTISGCNEVLNGIRSVAAENPNMKQLVSIYCFDSCHSRYIMENQEIEKTGDITPDDYRPNASTPLYDAIGFTVSRLEEIVRGTDSTAKVTIITDGMENASVEWSHDRVNGLIERLKQQGWLFTFIGADIDVERTSKGLGIDIFKEFKKTDRGMSDLFHTEIRAQRKYSEKMNYMRSRAFWQGACDAKKKEMLGLCGDGYFDNEDRIAPDNIRILGPEEIFVFGSNIHGSHNGYAAAMAMARFGAVMGQAEGLQGQSYAIPVGGASIQDVHNAIIRFTDYVIQNQDKKFILTAVGCGGAGYQPHQIAPLFRTAYQFGNVYVPKSFLPFVKE